MASRYAIGIDVGGTKCAGGLVELPQGRILARRLQPTEPRRGGQAVLADVIEQARSLREEAKGLGVDPTDVGLAVAELVSNSGEVLSDATIAWKNLDVKASIATAAGLPLYLEADVRAAARAEGRLGAASGLQSFLYVTIGTGISAALVQDGVPYAGARGLTGTFASGPGLIPGDDGRLASGPPLEQFAGGPALSERFSALRKDRTYTTADVLALCESGDEGARSVVTSAGEAVGAAIAQLVNMLDPEAVVIGGGLGLAGGQYRDSLERCLRANVWSEFHRDVPLLPAALGVDAGVIGAAISATDPPPSKGGEQPSTVACDDRAQGGRSSRSD